MVIKFYNPKGQEVGFIEGDSYITSRDAKKGQIFLFKHVFDGKRMELPIGLQKDILDNLILRKVPYVDVIILNIEDRSYLTRTKVEDIHKEGVLIKEDRGDKNLTKWGWQVIFDVANKKFDLKQKTLNSG